jgi:hypothetical protein
MQLFLYAVGIAIIAIFQCMRWTGRAVLQQPVLALYLSRL